MDPAALQKLLPAVIAGLLLLISFSGSLAFWVSIPVWGEQVQRGILLNRSRGAADFPVAAASITGVWIAYLLLNLVMSLVGPAHEFNERQTIFGLLVTVVVSGMLLVVILSPLLMFTDNYQRALLGFRGERIPSQLGAGVLGLFAAFLPVYAVLLSTSFLRTEESTHDAIQLLTGTGSPLLIGLVVLVAVIVAPVTEELVFRVVLQTCLRRFLNPVPAILISSTIFAAVHGFPDSLGVFVLALILGSLYEVRRSYVTVVTLHLLFNAYNLVLAALTADLVKGM